MQGNFSEKESTPALFDRKKLENSNTLVKKAQIKVLYHWEK